MPLPIRNPPLQLASIEPELSEANLALGRLDGISDVVPDPDLFVMMYVRQEAVLSSRIEGTEASLSDVLDDEAGVPLGVKRRPADVLEVRNYVRALNAGLVRLEQLPLSLRLIREMHQVLLEGVRGRDKTPGEFRRSQNWIGPDGCLLQYATFVPPPYTELPEHLNSLERYLREDDSTPVLVRAGVAHAQFETIHPFLDGNGRMGRLLITFMLCERKVLRRPLLYLSEFFTRRKMMYYDWLMRIRQEGDWEGWLRFFLTGIADAATQARETAHRVLALQQSERNLVHARFPSKPNLLRLLEALYKSPTVTVAIAAGLINVTIPTANSLVADLTSIGILREITGRERDRVFRHVAYLRTLTPDEPEPVVEE